MRWPLVRAFVVLLALPLLAAALTRPPVPGLPFAIAGLGLVLGFAGRSALLVLFARRGLAVLSAAAPGRSGALGNLLAGLLGAAVASPFGVALEGYARAAVFLGGAAALVPATALALRDASRPRGTRTVGLWTWLVVDHGLPAGMLAATAGTGALWLRLHALEVVPPGELARHLGGTTCLYALLLGLGGALKGFAELRCRLVAVTLPAWRAPGPVLPGLALGTALLLAAPLLPALPFTTVLVVKIAFGVVVGGALSALGALQGARRAGGEAPGSAL